MLTLELGQREIPDGQYEIIFRNCQTTTKRFAEKIVEEDNMDPLFTWPWRSSSAAMAVFGILVGGAACYYLFPYMAASA
jgi:hypothetical protein